MRTHPAGTAVRRAVAAVAIGGTIALTTTACGDDTATTPDDSSEVSSTEHNDADVSFASDMIQHHAQALSMVDLTRERPLDPEVQQLAEQVRDAQGPEIETMADWLSAWGEDVPETMRDHANAGHGTGDVSESMEEMEDMADMEDMPGMMTAEDLDALENASDEEFQARWLEMMIEHHRGAVEMAATEQDDGRYAPAVDLAATIVETQGAEVATMEDLLG